MRLIDLELYKWKWFHNIHLKINQTCAENLIDRWKETDAFVSILPRRSGKTTMVKMLEYQFKSNIEDYLIVVPSVTGMHRAIRCHNFDTKHILSVSQALIDQGFFRNNCNLIIDEFTSIDEMNLDKLLDHNWKTVTMIGTLR